MRRVPVEPQPGNVPTGHLAVLDASPNAIVAVDAEARIVYVNPQVTRTFGYAPEELVGRSVEVLVPKHVAGDHVRHRAAFIGQPTARPMGIGLDLAGRRKDGTEFPVEISLSPVETEDGCRVFATIVDITARKAAEEQLRQAQKMESIGAPRRRRRARLQQHADGDPRLRRDPAQRDCPAGDASARELVGEIAGRGRPGRPR